MNADFVVVAGHELTPMGSVRGVLSSKRAKKFRGVRARAAVVREILPLGCRAGLHGVTALGWAEPFGGFQAHKLIFVEETAINKTTRLGLRYRI